MSEDRNQNESINNGEPPLIIRDSKNMKPNVKNKDIKKATGSKSQMFYKKIDDIYYRIKETNNVKKKRILLPRKCRAEVLNLAHNIP